MDEHTIKRLVKIILVSIIVIVLAKYFLTKAYTTLNKATAEKQQPTPATDTALSDVVPEALTTTEVIDVAASSVEVTAP